MVKSWNEDRKLGQMAVSMGQSKQIKDAGHKLNIAQSFKARVENRHSLSL